jgi:endonuclease YncB( thermonuclease family)
MRTLLLPLLLITSVSSVLGQKIGISRIIGSNLFELTTGERVMLAGVKAPSTSDVLLGEVASDAMEYAERMLVDQLVDIKLLDSPNQHNQYRRAYITRIYATSILEMSKRFLEKGFGFFDSTGISNERAIQYVVAQREARESKRGIWGIFSDEGIRTAQTDSIRESWTSLADLSEQHTLLPSSEIMNSYLKVRPQILLSVVSLGLSWDFLAEASDLNDLANSIDKQLEQARANHSPQDLIASLVNEKSNAESSKTRKSIIGWSCLVVGVVNVFFSFETVEVKAKTNALTLLYKF